MDESIKEKIKDLFFQKIKDEPDFIHKAFENNQSLEEELIILKSFALE